MWYSTTGIIPLHNTTTTSFSIILLSFIHVITWMINLVILYIVVHVLNFDLIRSVF